jgi:dolichol-phosphate mannosyltransferase
MKLSIIIPSYNEAENITETIKGLYTVLLKEMVDHEILVIDDNSNDNTTSVLDTLCGSIPSLQYYTNSGPNGFGYAVRYGLERFSGDCVAIMMADLSDDPNDLVKFYRELQKGYDCVFGTRWTKGGKTYGYPFLKKLINRLANNIVRISLGIRYNDCTNAFKLYKRETIMGLMPLLSPHFNLTLELPLKAIVRGYTYSVLPNNWRNRKHGISKLKIKEMGSRYFFILLYCLIEKFFSRGDFKKEKNSKNN